MVMERTNGAPTISTDAHRRSFHLVDRSCHRRKEDVSLVRAFFLANGWAEAEGVEEAGYTILFTCAEMRYKVANMIREVERLSQRIGPGGELIVGACLPKTNPEELARVFHGRTITPTDLGALDSLPGIRTRIAEIPAAFGANATCHPAERRGRWSGDDRIPYRLSRWAARVVRRLPLRRSVETAARLARTRRMTIHVSAGCAMSCSYCAIRFATGPVRSKPPAVIMEQIKAGLRQGYRTFDFLSDSIGGYGRDLGTDLGELFALILSQRGLFTIGVSDLHPHDFLRHFERILALCRADRLHYLYVPVQSGNERILRLMSRPCDVAELAARLLEIRSQVGVFLQTGIIVGFPGETEEEFEDTLAFLRKVGFDSVYVHYYCDMPHTRSSSLPGKIDKETMVARLEKLRRRGIPHNVAKTLHEWESTLVIS
jgi:threonylcarbamoyladenosine tRNA methylthiotransferase CDKAL1